MRRGSVAFISVFALTLALLLPGGSVRAGEMIRMSSGTLTGSWYPLMTFIGERVIKPEGFEYTNKPGGGVTNIIAVGVGKADMGLAMATGIDMAAKGRSRKRSRASSCSPASSPPCSTSW